MINNRASNLLRLATKGKPLSAIAYFDDTAQKYGALVYHGTVESEFTATGTYENFINALETIGIKFQKRAKPLCQLVGTMVTKYLENPAFEKI